MVLAKEKAGPGVESVWDYPRPPRLEATNNHIEVFYNGEKIADTRRAVRVLETSHPPVFYLPSEDIRGDCLIATPRSTVCEWKGKAVYYAVSVMGKTSREAAWCYPVPREGYEAIAGHVAFYPALMDECLVDGERVVAQPGGFYGGWITKEIMGPFKGEPGSEAW